LTKVLSFGRAVSYAWGMTIIARLRLLLAILALALPPLGGAAPSAAAAMPMMMVMEDCDGHDCAAPAAPPASHHAAIACALGCLQAQMPAPLLLSAQIVPVGPAVQRSPLAPPAQAPLFSHAPSPPERPPRA
jgi:hypothetical protein